jgi:hypothetical protein
VELVAGWLDEHLDRYVDGDVVGVGEGGEQKRGAKKHQRPALPTPCWGDGSQTRQSGDWRSQGKPGARFVRGSLIADLANRCAAAFSSAKLAPHGFQFEMGGGVITAVILRMVPSDLLST